MWRITSYEQRGKYNNNNDILCQNKTYKLAKNNVYAIALGDGLSSNKYSHIGAEIVTEKICKVLCSEFDHLFYQPKENVTKKVAGSCILGIHERYKNCNIKEFSSTLLFVAVKGSQYIAGHMGNGIIGFEKNGNVEILSRNDDFSEINSPYFITNIKEINKISIYRGNIKDITGFILISDGMADSLYDKRNENLAKAASTMMGWVDIKTEEEVSKALKVNFENLFLENTNKDCGVAIMKYKKPMEEIEIIPYYNPPWWEKYTRNLKAPLLKLEKYKIKNR